MLATPMIDARYFQLRIGTVENHGKKWQKTRHTFVKIAKITAKSRQ